MHLSYIDRYICIYTKRSTPNYDFPEILSYMWMVNRPSRREVSRYCREAEYDSGNITQNMLPPPPKYILKLMAVKMKKSLVRGSRCGIRQTIESRILRGSADRRRD
jgi:hypothetical protein